MRAQAAPEYIAIYDTKKPVPGFYAFFTRQAIFSYPVFIPISLTSPHHFDNEEKVHGHLIFSGHCRPLGRDGVTGRGL
jgi:hypothetical protein